MKAGDGADPARTPWPLFVVVLAPAFLIAMCYTLVMPVLPAVAKHFGGGDGAELVAQYFIAVAGVGVILGAPVAGVMVDRSGYRRVLIISLLVYVAAGLAGAVIIDRWALLGARLALGMGAGGYATAAGALLGQLWSEDKRAKIIGYITATGAFAALLTLLMAGAAADLLTWRAPFLLYVLALPLVLACLTVRGDGPEPRRRVKKAGWADWRPLAPIFLAALPLYIVMNTSGVQLPLLLSDIGLKTASERSLMLTVPSLCSALAGLSYARISGLLGSRRMFVLILLISAGAIVAMGLTTNLATAVVCVVLCGAGLGLMPAHFKFEVLAQAPTPMRGRAVAALVSLQNIAQMLNPLLIGSLGLAYGLRPALTATGALLIAWLIAAVAAQSRSWAPKAT
jgi:MFS family permease